MTSTQVRMDNCGIEIIIKGMMDSNSNIKLEIISDCENIQKLAKELKEVELSQLMQTIDGSIIYQTAAKFIKHPACLVPTAIIRTMEIEAGIALPGESSISTRKV